MATVCLSNSFRLFGLIAFAVVLACSGTVSAEAPSWWPGGSDSQAESPAPEAADESAMVDSPLFKMSWPKIEMPKIAWKPGFGGGESTGQPTANGNPISRALDKVADGSKKAADNVRGVWDSTLSKLPFSGGQGTQTAKNDGGGFWSRLMAPEEPQGSETVQGFLAQERVGTVR